MVSRTEHALILMVGGHYTYAKVPLGFWVQDALHLARKTTTASAIRAGIRAGHRRARGSPRPVTARTGQMAVLSRHERMPCREHVLRVRRMGGGCPGRLL